MSNRWSPFQPYGGFGPGSTGGPTGGGAGGSGGSAGGVLFGAFPTMYVECGSPPSSNVGTFLTWDTLYDVTQTVVGAMPEEIGLSLVSSGTQLEARAAGTWLFRFELLGNLPNSGTALMFNPTFIGNPRVVITSGVVPDPQQWEITCPMAAGDQVGIQVINTVNGSACLQYADMQITRLV